MSHSVSEAEDTAALPTVARVLPRRGKRLQALVRALRVHQWVKNLLLFVPLILAHRISDGPSLRKSLLGFFCFSLCASSVYVLNDILDLQAYRAHPTKCRRPFAAGDLTTSTGIVLVPLLLTLGV